MFMTISLLVCHVCHVYVTCVAGAGPAAHRVGAVRLVVCAVAVGVSAVG